MASPETVDMIKFKSISSQLSDNEMDTFIIKLWRSIGRDRILQFLCTSLLTFAANQKYVDILPTAFNIISQIILERDTDDEPDDAVPKTMTDLPSCLVGEIASNLAPLDYIAFSQTNRKIFVDCHSPNRLQKLTVQQCHDCSRIRLHHFPQIKHLDFDLGRITEFYQNNGQIFGGNNKLQTLAIDGENAMNSDTDCLISDQSPCISRIQTLVLFSRGDDDYELDSNRFLKLLSKFEHLKELWLNRVLITGPMRNDDLRMLCPQITDLHLLDMRPINSFLESWCGKLQTLSLELQEAAGIWVRPKCELSSLRRVHAAGLVFSETMFLLDMAMNATEISLIPNEVGPPENPTLSEEETRDVIKRCLSRSTLEYLYICGVCQLSSVCHGIQIGLDETKEIERERMEIRLNVNAQAVSDPHEFVCSISRIVHSFADSSVEQWEFVVDFEKKRNDCQGNENWTAVLDAVKESQDLFTVIECMSSWRRGLAISNQASSTMRRHQAWWCNELL